MISTLPSALQGSYMKALKLQHTVHMQAEVKALEGIVKTLLETNNYLAGASDAEKGTIAKVLYFFNQGGPEHDGDGSAESVEGMVSKMLRDNQNKIKQLQEEILRRQAK